MVTFVFIRSGTLVMPKNIKDGNSVDACIAEVVIVLGVTVLLDFFQEEEDSWISGEELYTEGSSDDEGGVHAHAHAHVHTHPHPHIRIPSSPSPHASANVDLPKSPVQPSLSTTPSAASEPAEQVRDMCYYNVLRVKTRPIIVDSGSSSGEGKLVSEEMSAEQCNFLIENKNRETL